MSSALLSLPEAPENAAGFSIAGRGARFAVNGLLASPAPFSRAIAAPVAGPAPATVSPRGRGRTAAEPVDAKEKARLAALFRHDRDFNVFFGLLAGGGAPAAGDPGRGAAFPRNPAA